MATPMYQLPGVAGGRGLLSPTTGSGVAPAATAAAMPAAGGGRGRWGNLALGAGLGLLSQGWSRVPQSPWQGLGRGLMLGLEMDRTQAEEERARTLAEAQLEMQRERLAMARAQADRQAEQWRIQQAAQQQAAGIIGAPGAPTAGPPTRAGAYPSVGGTGLAGGELTQREAGMQFLGVPGYENVGVNLLAQLNKAPPKDPMAQYRAFSAMSPEDQASFLAMRRSMQPQPQGYVEEPLETEAAKWINDAGENPPPTMLPSVAAAAGFRPQTGAEDKLAGMRANLQFNMERQAAARAEYDAAREAMRASPEDPEVRNRFANAQQALIDAIAYVRNPGGEPGGAVRSGVKVPGVATELAREGVRRVREKFDFLWGDEAEGQSPAAAGRVVQPNSDLEQRLLDLLED